MEEGTGSCEIEAGFNTQYILLILQNNKFFISFNTFPEKNGRICWNINSTLICMIIVANGRICAMFQRYFDSELPPVTWHTIQAFWSPKFMHISLTLIYSLDQKIKELKEGMRDPECTQHYSTSKPALLIPNSQCLELIEG